MARLEPADRRIAQVRLASLMIEELSYQQYALAGPLAEQAVLNGDRLTRRLARQVRRLARQVDAATVAIAINQGRQAVRPTKGQRRRIRRSLERRLALRQRLGQRLEALAARLDSDPMSTGELFEAMADDWRQGLFSTTESDTGRRQASS